MLLVYDPCKYFYSYTAGIDFRCQILTSKVDPRSVRIETTFTRPVLTLARSCSGRVVIRDSVRIKSGCIIGDGIGSGKDTIILRSGDVSVA